MNTSRKAFWGKTTLLFGVGAIGIASVLPIIPTLAEFSGEPLPVPIGLLQLISFLQSSIFLLVAVILGMWLAPKVNLHTPIIDALLNTKVPMPRLASITIWAAIGGVCGGILISLVFALMAPSLPDPFLRNAEQFSLPLLTRLLYGGVTEELLIRWGLMTAIVFGLAQTIWKKHPQSPLPYLLGIVISAFIFAIGHLPIATMLAEALTPSLIVYVLVGNSIFGVIAGWLYWQKGLEAAIVAHMIAHITMLLGEQLVA